MVSGSYVSCDGRSNSGRKKGVDRRGKRLEKKRSEVNFCLLLSGNLRFLVYRQLLCWPIMSDGVQISIALIHRLLDDDLKSLKKAKKTNMPKIRIQHQQQNKAENKQISKEPQNPNKIPPARWPFQTPFFLPTTAPSLNPKLEAIRLVLKEGENVLEKLQTHAENMVKKVTERGKELHEEFKLPQQKTVVCLPEKDACLSCYKDHLDEPVKCASLVSHYHDCVRRAKKEVHGINN